MATHQLVTAEELERMGSRNGDYELVRGDLVPDLAVEVRSPDDAPGELSAKAHEYLDAGARLGWVVDPPAHTVRVHEPGRTPRVLGMDAALDGSEVLPGFTLPLAELFGEE